MRGLQITVFVLGFVVLGTQTLRHVYVRWIEPRGSVLDEFKEQVEEDIAASKDLDDLTALYEVAHEKLKAYEATHPDIEVRDRNERQLIEEERTLRNAIERVEGQRQSIFQLWFYWSCGLLGVVVGVLVYGRVNRWLGMVGMIMGFTEMACWTSPLWRTAGPQGEFERLLTLKLVLSVVSLALLVALWLRSDRAAGAGPAPDGAG